MKADETARLVAELEALPEYRGWKFTYEYPGFFCYRHPDNGYTVFFTPDWDADETLPIQIQIDDDPCPCEGYCELPLPREGRTGQLIFELVRPTLHKLLAGLTKTEIETLQHAYEQICPTPAERLPPQPLRPLPLPSFATAVPVPELPTFAPAVPVPELLVRLTKAEVAALQKAHEHVRVHMAHEHPWEIRDTAMGAISKVLAAASNARS